MNLVRSLFSASAIALLVASTANAAAWSRCGGCTDPCAKPKVARCVQGCQPAHCGPMTEARIVMVPTYVCETRTVCTTEYKKEERKRSYTVYRKVPVEEERVEMYTVMVAKKETKKIPYTVSVPVTETETKEYTVSVPVWKDVTNEYNIKVPHLTQMEEKYTVKVPQVKDATYTYCVNVPYPETRTATRVVTNCIPTVKTKTAMINVPVHKTRKVTKDCGYWECQVKEVPCHHGHGCAHGCGTKTVMCRVWVPNLIVAEWLIIATPAMAWGLKKASAETLRLLGVHTK